jgi:LPXTG-site transpeptidase (sortase) family protein
MFNNFYSKLKSTKFSFLAGLSFVVLGLALGGYLAINTWQTQKPAVAASNREILESNKATDDGSKIISGKPVRIQIPSVGIDLKVIPGYYYKQSNSWTLTLNAAQWGTMTAKANNKEGATFIYAHYREGIFLTLPKIKPGEKAIVTAEIGYRFIYEFKASTIVSPSDGSILNYRGKPILVLQTCTGIWYQNRQLFKFDLVRAK